MKNLSILMCCVLLLSVLSMGCAQEQYMTLCDDEGHAERVLVEPYGAFDSHVKDPRVNYDISVGNVVWSVLLFSTAVVPIVLLGWYAKKPVLAMPNNCAAQH